MTLRRCLLGLVTLVVVAACASTPAASGSQGMMIERALDPSDGAAPRPSPAVAQEIPLGNGISLRSGPRILTLPSEQRYRFVGADAIVRGATSEDLASASRPGDLRESLETVLQSRGWRPAEDSADYDITILISRRTHMASGTREEQLPSTRESTMPRCDASRGGNQPACTNERYPPTRRVSTVSPQTVTRYIHVIRRRSDGAVRYWSHTGNNIEAVKGLVARDLMETLLTQER